MTQTETHTPGPWRYEAGTKTIRSEPANYWLASMNSWDGAVNHEANAQLIAKAPQLLAALRDLLACADAECVTGSSHEPIENARRLITELDGAQ